MALAIVQNEGVAYGAGKVCLVLNFLIHSLAPIMYFIWLLIVALGIATLYAVNGWKSKQSRGPLPPGPAPLPIVGNIRDLPPKGTQDWVHWLKHKALYGELCNTQGVSARFDRAILNRGMLTYVQDQSALSLSWDKPLSL